VAISRNCDDSPGFLCLLLREGLLCLVAGVVRVTLRAVC
jgi:hypothetical protein